MHIRVRFTIYYLRRLPSSSSTSNLKALLVFGARHFVSASNLDGMDKL